MPCAHESWPTLRIKPSRRMLTCLRLVGCTNRVSTCGRKCWTRTPACGLIRRQVQISWNTLTSYNEILQQLDLRLSDEEVDASFPLWDIVEGGDQERKYFDDIAEHKKRLKGGDQSEESAEETPAEDAEASE